MEERPKSTCERMEEAMCHHCPAMTWEQRLVGCLGCFIIGAWLNTCITYMYILYICILMYIYIYIVVEYIYYMYI